MLPIPRISAHAPILAQCKVHPPWALFREGTIFSILHYSLLRFMDKSNIRFGNEIWTKYMITTKIVIQNVLGYLHCDETSNLCIFFGKANSSIIQDVFLY